MINSPCPTRPIDPPRLYWAVDGDGRRCRHPYGPVRTFTKLPEPPSHTGMVHCLDSKDGSDCWFFPSSLKEVQIP